MTNLRLRQMQRCGVRVPGYSNIHLVQLVLEPQNVSECTCLRRAVVYLSSLMMDGNSPTTAHHGTLDEDQLGFLLEAEGVSVPLPCKLVRGFQQAMIAAQDPRTPMPSRLVIISPDVVTFDWLAAWSEDDQQVRRTLSIRRRTDGATVIAVVTLAAFGYATHTSLTVESLTLPSQGRRIVRSGVHPKSFLDAIRAHHKRATQSSVTDDDRSEPPNGEAS